MKKWPLLVALLMTPVVFSPTFDIAYAMGASISNLVSQPWEYGGLGLGTIVTSVMFLGIIVATIIYMTSAYEPERAIPEGDAVNP